jgi:hypothetical protein
MVALADWAPATGQIPSAAAIDATAIAAAAPAATNNGANYRGLSDIAVLQKAGLLWPPLQRSPKVTITATTDWHQIGATYGPTLGDGCNLVDGPARCPLGRRD